jgi:putative CocE/NonD family hydrolase
MFWRVAVLALFGCCPIVHAATDEYAHEDVMIPMRDGVRLHAQVWRPKQATRSLPILLQRSPYGYPPEKVKDLFASEYRELAHDGFIFVLQDIRGRFGSEGQFVMLRPKATDSKGVDESTDAFDSIDWLVKHVPGNNGAAGVFGVSYMGWTTAMATINPHPALKAVSVQAAPEDMYLGDDFHHNGAFRLQYAWEYVTALESDGRTLQPMNYGKEDPYSWLLKSGQLASLDQRTRGHALPSWRNFVDHPDSDAFWRSAVTSTVMPSQPQIPNLIVAGWWDQEDFYGPLTIYQRQEKGDVHNRNFLVVGPWRHGGWMEAKADHYGPFDLGADTATDFRAKVETPWFRYWLKHEGTLQQPEAYIFETGSNQWKSYDAWPPRRGVTARSLHLHANHVLSFEPPRPDADSKADSFVSDPANPVPYRNRPIAPLVYPDGSESTWRTWLSDDQTAFASRPDVLFWQSQPLTSDLTIRGSVTAKLFASTTGSDADWVVKLLDVYPDTEAAEAGVRGRSLMIANDVFRARYRSGFEHPVALTPGAVVPYSIDLHSASHVFKKGHRIAVQVQSTWFPLIDRNPQVFLPSIFQAQPEQYKAQTHSVWHTKEFPSAIVVDVAPN